MYSVPHSKEFSSILASMPLFHQINRTFYGVFEYFNIFAVVMRRSLIGFGFGIFMGAYKFFCLCNIHIVTANKFDSLKLFFFIVKQQQSSRVTFRKVVISY